MKNEFFIIILAFIGVGAQSREKSPTEIPPFAVISADKDDNNLQNNNMANRNSFIPPVCPEDQLLYPGDENNEWECDCVPGFVYHPKSDKCYCNYKRGPCQAGYYLVLQSRDEQPKCLKNPCKVDGMVRFKGQCWQLEKPGGPCSLNGAGQSEILGINATTLEPDCMPEDYPRLNEIKDYYQNAKRTKKHITRKLTAYCHQSRYRYLYGRCRKIYIRHSRLRNQVL